MTTYINDLTGVDSAALTNESSAAGGTPFNESDTLQVGSGASITHSTSNGEPAMAFTTGATSTVARRGWQVNPSGTTDNQYVSFYFDRDDFTLGTALFPVRAMDATSNSQRMRIQITNNGFIQLRDAANAQVWSSTQLSTDVRYRVEVMYGGTASSQCQVKIFEDENTSPVQDSGLLSGVNFGGPTQSVWFGQTSAITNSAGKIGRVGWSDTTWIGPHTETAGTYAEVHLGTAVPTNTSAKVSQRWVNAETMSMRLLVSTFPDLRNPVYGDFVTVDDKRWAQMSVSGLIPNTFYYGAVDVNGAISASGRFTFKTAPFDGDGVSHSIFFGGGRQVDGGEEAFAAMKSLVDSSGSLEGRAVLLADLGNNGFMDWGVGATEDEVLDHLVSQANYSTIPNLMADLPWAFILGSRDHDGAAAQAAYRRAVPRISLPSADALYGSFDWGRARFILTDNWSQRDPETDPDGPNKRMWSQAQEDWFISRVKEWPWAICVLGGLSCRSDDPSTGGWSSYATQFNRIHNRLNAVDSLKRLVWLSADRMALAADLGTTPGTRGVPQATAGPFDGNSVDLNSGEMWSEGFYNVTSNGLMTAFGEASFSDSGGDIITFTFIGRTADGTVRVQASKNLDVRPIVRWRKPIGI